MSLLGMLKRSMSTRSPAPKPVYKTLPSPPIPTPAVAEDPPLRGDDLRDALFRAVAVGDEAAVSQLCTRHRDALVDYFSRWQPLSDALQGNPAAADWYRRGIEHLSALSLR